MKLVRLLVRWLLAVQITRSVGGAPSGSLRGAADEPSARPARTSAPGQTVPVPKSQVGHGGSEEKVEAKIASKTKASEKSNEMKGTTPDGEGVPAPEKGEAGPLEGEWSKWEDVNNLQAKEDADTTADGGSVTLEGEEAPSKEEWRKWEDVDNLKAKEDSDLTADGGSVTLEGEEAPSKGEWSKWEDVNNLKAKEDADTTADGDSVTLEGEEAPSKEEWRKWEDVDNLKAKEDSDLTADGDSVTLEGEEAPSKEEWRKWEDVNNLKAKKGAAADANGAPAQEEIEGVPSKGEWSKSEDADNLHGQPWQAQWDAYAIGQGRVPSESGWVVGIKDPEKFLFREAKQSSFAMGVAPRSVNFLAIFCGLQALQVLVR